MSSFMANYIAAGIKANEDPNQRIGFQVTFELRNQDAEKQIVELINQFSRVDGVNIDLGRQDWYLMTTIVTINIEASAHILMTFLHIVYTLGTLSGKEMFGDFVECIADSRSVEGLGVETP